MRYVPSEVLKDVAQRIALNMVGSSDIAVLLAG